MRKIRLFLPEYYQKYTFYRTINTMTNPCTQFLICDSHMRYVVWLNQFGGTPSPKEWSKEKIKENKSKTDEL